MEEEKRQNVQTGEFVPKKNKGWRIVSWILTIVLSFLAGAGVLWISLDEGMRTLIGIKNRIDRDYYKEIPDEVFYGALYDTVNNRLLDAYSQYITPDKYVEQNASDAGKRQGIGLVFLTKTEDGKDQMLVYRVSGNSPAEEAGFRAGDSLTAFGVAQDDMKESVVFDDFSNFLSERETGESFFVRVRRGEEEKVLSVSVKNYIESYVFYRTKNSSYIFSGADGSVMTERGEGLTCLPEDTAYIRLVQFTGKAYDLFAKSMDKFKEEGKRNLVLDLRGNGGGNLDIMQGIAGYFCKNSDSKKPLALIADYGERKTKFYAKNNIYYDYFTKESRICVLADEGTASASEALMGVMFDYGAITHEDLCLTKNGKVAKTYGKGIMQTTFLMDIIKQDALKLTTATIHWPISYTCIHDTGVTATEKTKVVEKNYEGEKELYLAIEKLFG